MLKIITPIAHLIILTSFQTKNQDMVNIAASPEEVGQKLKEVGFKNFLVIPIYPEAWLKIVKEKGLIVDTPTQHTAEADQRQLIFYCKKVLQFFFLNFSAINEGKAKWNRSRNYEQD